MITEPSTLATDYALAALTAWLAWRLRDVARERRQRSVRLWSFGFMAAALGGFTGGTYHGFTALFPAPVSPGIWTITTIAVGLAGCLLLLAALTATVRAPIRRWLAPAVWVQFVGYVGWMLSHDDFLYVIVEYGSAMLFILLLQVAVPAARRAPSARWIIAGVAVTIAAAAIQQSGFDLHRRLNHNDLQHLVQMVGVWLLYKGGTTLTDAGG